MPILKNSFFFLSITSKLLYIQVNQGSSSHDTLPVRYLTPGILSVLSPKSVNSYVPQNHISQHPL